MFPGYLFAEFVYAESHRQVQQGSGVQGIVHFGDQVAVLDSRTIEVLRERTGDQELVTIDHTIDTGQVIQITEGPFQGIDAIVTKVFPGKQRIRVLFELLNRPLELETPLFKVVPKDRPEV